MVNHHNFFIIKVAKDVIEKGFDGSEITKLKGEREST